MMSNLSSSDAWLETADEQKFPIEGVFSLGRSKKNSVKLSDSNVSRRHAILNPMHNGEIWLVDLGSINGTYLNAQRIIQPVQLRDGDRIELAGHAFVFHQTKMRSDSLETLSSSTVANVHTESLWLLLADIENYTLLARTLPPERLAVLVGGWFRECQRVIEEHFGRIYKYLGDGFLATWRDDSSSTIRVAAAAKDLVAITNTTEPRFRIVIHRGMVSKGGCLVPGDESLIGSAMNFVFRMEKLAAQLRVPVLLSKDSHSMLSAHVASESAGSYPLKGFEGQFSFFVLQSDSNMPARQV